MKYDRIKSSEPLTPESSRGGLSTHQAAMYNPSELFWGSIRSPRAHFLSGPSNPEGDDTLIQLLYKHLHRDLITTFSSHKSRPATGVCMFIEDGILCKRLKFAAPPDMTYCAVSLLVSGE